MQSLIDAIIVEWGWRRAALAFVAGAASALAFAPFDALPVLWFTVPVLIFLIDGAVGAEGRFILIRLMPAALVGWWFGFGFFLAGLWWLGAAFLVDAEEFAWLMPVAVLALPAALALFFAFGTALARLLWSDGWPRILAFALAMTAAEWLRGTLFTGLPWNTFGYALMPHPVLMQPAALVGLWGMTFLAFLIFAAPVLALEGTRRDRKGRLVFLGLILLIVMGDLGYGLVRLSHAERAMVDGVRIRIVQPNIAQDEKWRAGNADTVFRRTLQLSANGGGSDRRDLSGITHVVWPETAFPFLLTETPAALTALADLLPPGTTLIAGAARTEKGTPGQEPFFFNSIYVINHAGEIEGAYDKVHLVPFGEYLPFQSWLESLGIRQLTRLPGGFSAGTGHRLLQSKPAPPFSPLVCYEAIFPGEAVPPGQRPGWLVNVTNDAWYGDTPGPRQHFRQAMLRAVEQGLPMVRAANSGISAIIDPYGRTVSRLELGVAGTLDGELPRALPPTLYASHGWAILSVLFALAGLVWLAGRLRIR